MFGACMVLLGYMGCVWTVVIDGLIGICLFTRHWHDGIFRTREESDEDGAGTSRPERCVLSRGLEVGVQPGTYKLLYRNGSGDALWRWRTKEEEVVISTRAVAQSEERVRKMANIGLGQ